MPKRAAKFSITKETSITYISFFDGELFGEVVPLVRVFVSVDSGMIILIYNYVTKVKRTG